MTQYYIIYKRKSSNIWTDLIKLNPKASLSEIKSAMAKAVRPGFKTKIVSAKDVVNYIKGFPSPK